MEAPKPSNEFERLVGLSALDLDYTNLSDQLEDFTDLAARIARTDTSLVNIIDHNTQWTVAGSKKGLQQAPREVSVCQYAIMDNEPLEIKDLRKDERLRDNIYTHQRYYYGVPLETSKGVNIGCLCVLDPELKTLSLEDRELVNLIGKLVVGRLEALKKVNELEHTIKELGLAQRRISHDIRNPISGIIGLAQIVEDEIKNQHFDEAAEFVGMIKEGSNSLIELVEEITDQRAIPEQYQTNQNDFSCAALCQKLNMLYQPQAQSKNITLHIETPQTPREIFFPRTRLLQIAGNLISNSIKFTGSGESVNVEIRTEKTRDEKKNTTLSIKITDTSEGISPEKAAEIMQETGHSERGVKREKGYGFGISLVHRLVQKAGGSMEVTSGQTKGVTSLIQLTV